jgi:2-succinyl-5-enolpyruvyl-6-hydroxy-3-cyclohexene-1-carboxylate synthase
VSDQAATVRALLATLVAGGLKHLVISPGSRSTPLVQAAAERPELTLHVVLDERAAGFFALGLARSTQTLCGTLCTSGSAVAHVLPAAIEATESGDALLALTADRPAAVRGLGAPQAILQPGLLAPYAQHFSEIDGANPEVRADLRALQQALGELRLTGGVAHVNVPLALPLALAPGDLPPLPALLDVAPLQSGPAIPPPQLDERVLVIAGALPFNADLADFLRMRLTGTVTIAEPASRLRDALVGMRHADAYLRDPDARAALVPDRIVRLGAWPVSKGLQLLLEDAKRIGLPVDVVQPRRVSDPLRQNRLTLTDEVAAALRDWPVSVRQPVSTRPASPWQAAWQTRDALVTPPEAAWHEAQAIEILARSLPAHSTLLLGNSMPIRDWDSFAPPLAADVDMEVSRGAAGIDGALATIAGLAVGRQRPVTAYLGDCTFLHDIGSLQILADRRLRHAGVRICVADNDGGAIFDYLPARGAMSPALHEACFTATHGLDVAAMARGFGIATHVCADVAAWELALARPIPANGVEVLVARFDRAASEALHRAHWSRVGTLAAARCR